MAAHRTPIAHAIALSLAWTLGLGAGCAVQVEADPARAMLRPSYPTEDAWPSTRRASRQTSEAATIDWVAVARDENGRLKESFRAPVYRVIAIEAVGPCTVREVERIGGAGPTECTLIDVDVSVEGRPEGRDFSATIGGRSEAPMAIWQGATEVVGMVEGRPEMGTLSNEERFGPVVERLVMDRAFEFRPPAAGPARGLIVHIRSFIDNPFENSAVEFLRLRGWAVLSGSFATPLSTVGAFDLENDGVMDRAASRIAAAVDGICAERAYAFEAALSYLAQRHPEVPTHPTVLVGFSAGSLGVPVVAARMPRRFDAGVLICGGADLLSISQRNPLGKVGLTVTMRGQPLTEQALTRLSGDYLAAAMLDPYATAPALAGMPVLMLHAARDREIPAETGDLLYNRLGRPERWVFDGGHAWVFFLLPRTKGDIARWIDRAVADVESSDPDPSGPSDIAGGRREDSDGRSGG